MKQKARDTLLTVGWRLPGLRALSSCEPAILMYHGIPSRCNDTGVDTKVFERHIAFLQQHFEFVSPSDINRKRQPCDRIQVALTFDDGFRNHAEVVAPILRRHSVPALFFISSRHSQSGKYLWFSYLDALEKHFHGNGFYFGAEFVDMSSDKRRNNMRQLRQTLLSMEPHPHAMYQAIDNELPRLEDFVHTADLSDHFSGMTEEQVGELASERLFSVGVHTLDHAFLTKCESQESQRQIRDNKMWLERISNRPCDTIAYPGGAYNEAVINQCRALGLTAEYAITPTVNNDDQYEVPRIGVYSSSLAILGFKVQWGTLIGPLRYQVTGRV